MLAIIGFISIFSAFIVFFSDDLTAYVRALKAKSWLFLALSLLLASSVTVLCEHCFLWVVVTVWVRVLMMVEWLINQLRMHNVTIPFGLAKWLVFVAVCLSPILGARVLILMKKLFEKKALIWRRQSYNVSASLGIMVLIFLGLQLPGVNSY